MVRVYEVLEYIIEKYGSDHFCKIGTFGTLSAKAAIKDMARVLQYDFQKTNAITTKIQKVGIKISEILEQYAEVKELYDTDEDFKKVVDYASRLEGMQRHTSQHAAGIIISPFPLTDLVPLKGKGLDTSSQYDMGELEELGFVKLDILKLRTLTVIKDAVDSIEKHLGDHIEINKIDFEDDKVFQKFRDGETVGIFQYESDGMASLLKKQQPTNLNDLSAINALYRPGPLEALDEEHNMSMANVYVERAGGRMEVKYMHPLLETVQKDTYGVFVYQETVMQSSVALANYTLSESDDLRKAIGKKIAEMIAQHRVKFVEGCMSNENFYEHLGSMEEAKELAEKIYGQIETFARYGFNKSHSMAYSILAYQAMWLKVYYPEFFMASVLTSYIGKKIEEMIPYLNESRRLGLDILAPDVNQSTRKFEVSKDRKGIHFGLTGIKGVGDKAVASIIAVREQHPFRQLSDFIMMTPSNVNKTVTTALAKAGAFDFLGYNRRTMVKVVEDLILISSDIKKKITANKKRKNPLKDISHFYNPFYDYEVEILEEYTHEELCKMERDLTGFYMAHHPLEGLLNYIQSKTTHTASVINNGYAVATSMDFDIEDDDIVVPQQDDEEVEMEYEKLPVGQTVITGGVIKSVKEIVVKKGRNAGKTMASFILEDAYQGDVKCTAFVETYNRNLGLIQEGKVVFIRGNIDYFNDSTQVNIKDIHEVDKNQAKGIARNELLTELASVKGDIKAIEETMELLADDLDLIIDVTDELIPLYDKLSKLQQELIKMDGVTA